VLIADGFLRRATDIARQGHVALHIRGELSGKRLHEVATELAREVPDVVLAVNDRVDVAMTTGAGLVHLPEHGLPAKDVRALVAAEVSVGRSLHSPSDAQAALHDGADYVFLGPIFETPSHPGRMPLGTAALADVKGRVIAIGGITKERIPVCLDAGAYGVAAISALWKSPDPGAAAGQMLLLLGEPTS
jgi:thiamine-phosphate pyrophosphorylase